MSKLTGVARTNFFRVNDPAAFMHEMEQFDFTIHEKRIDGHLCFQLVDENSIGVFPTDRINEEGELETIDFPKFISGFLEEDTVAIFESIVFQNKDEIKSVTATAYNGKGEHLATIADRQTAVLAYLKSKQTSHASCGLQDAMAAS